jgi:hypothetical protein
MRSNLELLPVMNAKSRPQYISALNKVGEKRRNVGKLKNELNIVSQLVDLHFLLFVNITGN